MKFVRESLNEIFTDISDPIKDLGIGNKEALRKLKIEKTIKKMGLRGQILREEIDQLKYIFAEYLPYEKHKNEKDILEDMQSIWWNSIVEPGWEPKSLEKIMKLCYPKLKGEKLFYKGEEELSEICDIAVKLLGIPRSIVT
jgi:hypothetical protein